MDPLPDRAQTKEGPRKGKVKKLAAYDWTETLAAR